MPVPFLIQLEFVRHRRPRTYEAHVSVQNVEQLRHLVDAKSPEPSPKRSDSRVASDFINLGAARFRLLGRVALNPLFDVLAMNRVRALRAHGAKFQQLERLAVDSDPGLSKH